MNELDTYDEIQLAKLPVKNDFRQRGMEMTLTPVSAFKKRAVNLADALSTQ